MLENYGPPANESVSDFLKLLSNMKDALELLGKVGIYPELNEIQDVVFHYVQSLSDNVDTDARDRLFQFAEYVNLEVDQLKKVKA